MDHRHAARVFIEQVRRAVSMEQVLAHYGVERDFKKSAGQLFGRCPVHGGSHPRQCVIDPRKNVWRCFSPEHDSGGSVLDWVMQKEGVEVLEAARLLARWFAITPSPQTNRNHQPTDRRKR